MKHHLFTGGTSALSRSLEAAELSGGPTRIRNAEHEVDPTLSLAPVHLGKFEGLRVGSK